MPMMSRTVRSAGNRHLNGDTPLMPQARPAGYLPGIEGTAARRSPRGGADGRLRLERRVRWALRPARASGRGCGAPRRRRRHAGGCRRARQAAARAATAGPDTGADGIAGTGNGRARTGAVRAGDGQRPGYGGQPARWPGTVRGSLENPDSGGAGVAGRGADSSAAAGDSRSHVQDAVRAGRAGEPGDEGAGQAVPRVDGQAGVIDEDGLAELGVGACGLAGRDLGDVEGLDLAQPGPGRGDLGCRAWRRCLRSQ